VIHLSPLFLWTARSFVLVAAVTAAAAVEWPASARVLPAPAPTLCAQADSLRRAGRADLAEQLYREALARGGTRRCATEALSRAASATRLCAPGDALSDSGRSEAAARAYQRALERDPSSDCAVEGLREATSTSFGEWLGDAAGSLRDGAVVLIALVTAPLVVGYVLLLGLGRLPGVRSALTLAPPIRRRLGPRVRILDFDHTALGAEIGPSVAAKVRHAISRPLDRVAPGMRISGQADVAQGLRDVRALSPTAGMVVSALQVFGDLLPSKTFTVTGLLRPDVGRGVEATLTLSGGGPGESETLTSEEFEYDVDADTTDLTSRRLHGLAAAMADWIAHGIAIRVLGSSLTTADAKSFALFRNGVAWWREDPVRARRMFKRALHHDEGNAAALGSLAALESQAGRADESKELLDDAIDRIEKRSRETTGRVRGRLSALGVARHHRTPDWYRLKFNLTGLLAERAHVDAGAIPAARHHALELAVVAASTSRRLKWMRWIQREEGFREFLDEVMVPSAHALLGSLLDDRDQVKQAPGELAKDPGDLRPQLRRAQQRGDGAIPTIGALLASADRGIPRNPGTGYPRHTLACSLAHLASVLDKMDETRAVQAVVDRAFANIEGAIRDEPAVNRRRRAQALSSDGSLAALRAKPAYAERLNAIVERHNKPTTTQLLGRVKAIGPEAASALARVGIVSWDDLGDIETPSVSERLLFDEERVRACTDSYDLLATPGIGIGFANGLSKRGYGSLAALAEADPAELHGEIASEGLAPRLEDVAAWIESAKSRRPTATSGRQG
jgi:tetratricopeptide (TPR) repeat protein